MGYAIKSSKEKINIDEAFPEEYSDLIKLFGHERVNDCYARINEIYEFTEKIWAKYITMLPQGKVKFLLIAEAPPWSASGHPQYILDKLSRPRTLMKALKKTFISHPYSGLISAEDVLLIMANKGFLILDSLPFSMDYKNKRVSSKYKYLVRTAVHGYLKKKLNNSILSWDSDIRVAFSVKQNAIAVLEALENKIKLGSMTIKLNEYMIAVNKAGYPDANKLRNLYGF